MSIKEIIIKLIFILFTASITLGGTYFIAIKVKFMTDPRTEIKRAKYFVVFAACIFAHILVIYLLVAEIISESPTSRLSVFLIIVYSLLLFNTYIVWLFYKLDSEFSSWITNILKAINLHQGITKEQVDLLSKFFTHYKEHHKQEEET